VKSTDLRYRVAGVVANNTLDRTAGSPSLAAAGQRERSPHWWRRVRAKEVID